MSQRSPVAQHIVTAADKIEAMAGEFREALDSMKSKIETLTEQAQQPTAVTQPEDLSAELQTLDNALLHLEQAGSSLRGAASAIDNAGGSTDLSSLGQSGQGVGTGQGAPIMTTQSNPPSGSSETGPSGLSQSSATQQGGPQESPGAFDSSTTSQSSDEGDEGDDVDSGGVTPLSPSGGSQE
jgi:hypothetical protein